MTGHDRPIHDSYSGRRRENRAAREAGAAGRGRHGRRGLWSRTTRGADAQPGGGWEDTRRTWS